MHVLKPRKAKGAGGQKRSSKPTARMKPAAHEQKPTRRSAAEKAFAAPKPAAAASPAPAPRIAAQPSDADIRRDLQDRLVALHGRLKPVESKLAAQQDLASQLRSDKQAIRGQIQAIIPLAIYDELRKKLDQKTKRADNEQYEKLRALAFDAFGMPCGPTPELDLKGVPDAAKPASYYEEVGYQTAVGNGAGNGGDFADPVRDGVPPENHQDYMRGFTRGTERNARGVGLLETQPVAPVLPAASIPGAELREGVAASLAEAGESTGGQPDWSEFAEEPDEWTDAQTAVFDAWFATLGPEDEIDIQHPGVEKAFDAAEAAASAAAAVGEPSELI